MKDMRLLLNSVIDIWNPRHKFVTRKLWEVWGRIRNAWWQLANSYFEIRNKLGPKGVLFHRFFNEEVQNECEGIKVSKVD